MGAAKQRRSQYLGLGWRFCSARLRMANDTVTSRPRCLFVQQQPEMGNGRRGSNVFTLVPKTGWKLTNHHKTYLSVQCDTLCNCCSSVPITYQRLTTLVVLRWSGFEMLLLCKTQEKHPGASHPRYQTYPHHPNFDQKPITCKSRT